MSSFLSHPTNQVRGMLALACCISLFIASSPVNLFFAWLALMLPMVMLTGISRVHFRFLALVTAPITILLIIVWGYLVGAPPNKPFQSDPNGGIIYAATIAIRLMLIGGIFQLTFSTIPQERIPKLLSDWGIPKTVAVIILVTLSLLPEVHRRTNQLLDAYRARGLLKRGFVNKLSAIPKLLIPLIAWTFRTAIQRSEFAWGQRKLLENFSFTESPVATCRKSNVIHLLIAVMFCAVAILDWELMVQI